MPLNMTNERMWDLEKQCKRLSVNLHALDIVKNTLQRYTYDSPSYNGQCCKRLDTIKSTRFSKCNQFFKRLHLVLSHHPVLKEGEVLFKHMLIENYWTPCYLSNKSFLPSHVYFRHHSDARNKRWKQKLMRLLCGQVRLILFQCFNFLAFLSFHLKQVVMLREVIDVTHPIFCQI